MYSNVISQEISGYNKQCTSWDKWSNCVGECGGAGIASRYCIRTPNENVSYKNLEYEWKTCKLTRCSLQNYAEIIKGDEFREKELNYLETVVDNCQYRAILDSCIQDYCDYYSLKKILKNYTDRFWNALLCVKHNLGCPTKGGWSDWTLWSKCTATCGPGVQYRLRYCNNPMNSKDSLNCTGNSIEFKNCYGHLCESKTVYGGWSDWQKWSHCSTNCGKGNRYKLRSCTRPEPEETGIDCIGSPVEIANCYLEPCKGPLLMVYTFDKDALVQYSSTNIENSILHIFIRFYPLGGTGTLLRRFHDDCDKCDTVELSLANYDLILMAFLNGCTTKIYTSSIINVRT
ncbi:A disintegrin and metalloproteinase with thrombospondin motifs adt-1-like [Daktulosphaira vitifoliae]|uniref:A disintegrin and metalloproteinase with thrombospondin motifs adt-1-like n=1 Tax=Daktulosphaira vitifoliae TaxID=58002 RepID=UPI0021AA49D5|nr:A disintegrin and metalloproteinase with thrombospondin motifs adt-1-like [Daktulosphaira vitifoliae]